MVKKRIPQSVPQHLHESNALLWSAPGFIEWSSLQRQDNYVISGSAFIDLEDPLGRKGNPFTVVIGPIIQELDLDKKEVIAQDTGTPETIFINNCSQVSQKAEQLLYALNLTVKTPTGKELGACAHGFTGAIQTLLDLGQILAPSVVNITTTLQTTARAFISGNKIISLEFRLLEPRTVLAHPAAIKAIFHVDVLDEQKELSVLSVGSPKLMIELTQEQFNEVQMNLGQLDYEALLLLQNELHINGIHLFCRNDQNGLPEKVIQVNAFLGKDNVVDPATGVSCAAQIGADNRVEEGKIVKLTQYIAQGPSADLFVTKGENGVVYIGGTATLFNFQELGLEAIR